MQRNSVQVSITDGYIDEIINQVNNDSDIEMILLSNPNNPLGLLHKQADIIKILDNTDCYVVIDEAYQEFAGESVVDEINKYDKLIVLRTLSKAFSLANLRIGFAIANDKLCQFLKQCLGPFTLSDLNSKLATLAVKNHEKIVSSVEEIIKMRSDLQLLLKENNIEYIESSANYVFIIDDNINRLAEMLLANNYATATFPPNMMRLSIGSPEDMVNVKKIILEFVKER